MGAGNDLVLNYVDNNITSGSRGFQPARVSMTWLPELQLTGELQARWSISGAHGASLNQELHGVYLGHGVPLARESCQIHTYMELLHMFHYFAPLSYSTWHKPDCLWIGHDLFVFYVAIFGEELRVHDFIQCWNTIDFEIKYSTGNYTMWYLKQKWVEAEVKESTCWTLFT